MSHLRQQFLDRLSGTTLIGLTTTQTRVRVGSATPLGQDDQATLLVDLGAEQVSSAEILRGRQRVLDRQLELIVRAMVKGSGYVATLNTIALEVETAIAGDQSLGGLAKYVQLYEIEQPQIEGQGEKTVAELSMHFHIVYLSALNAPQTAR